jgi:hypothetical protein
MSKISKKINNNENGVISSALRAHQHQRGALYQHGARAGERKPMVAA